MHAKKVKLPIKSFQTIFWVGNCFNFYNLCHCVLNIIILKLNRCNIVLFMLFLVIIIIEMWRWRNFSLAFLVLRFYVFCVFRQTFFGQAKPIIKVLEHITLYCI